jgi:Lon protease-like protein
MKKKLPNDIPVFPLRDVIFFPNTNLPLNIFENRYLEMVNDILKTENKFLGMIQTKTNNELFNVGCIGQITDQEHLPDGRILINLKGVSRFTINKELETEKKYRVCNVSYEKYAQDIEEVSVAASTNQEMINKTKKFLEKNSILLNWQELNKLDFNEILNTMAMIAPISSEEKQKLLEAENFKTREQFFNEILDFYLLKTTPASKIFH